jgi:hypothetical protein
VNPPFSAALTVSMAEVRRIMQRFPRAIIDRLGATTLLIAVMAATGMVSASWGQTNSATPAAAPTYQIEGFRSAHFGMSESEVKAAIEGDFKVNGGAIRRTVQQVEQTTALTIATKDVVDGTGGPVEISYILGYKSKKLIQVNLIWTGSGAANASRLDRLTALLRGYFMQRDLRRDNMVVDAALPDGSVLAFSGSDAENRQVQLLVHPETHASGSQPAVPALVRLAYIADVLRPDVYSLPDGQF